jgi:hypothetical protein
VGESGKRNRFFIFEKVQEGKVRFLIFGKVQKGKVKGFSNFWQSEKVRFFNC